MGFLLQLCSASKAQNANPVTKTCQAELDTSMFVVLLGFMQGMVFGSPRIEMSMMDDEQQPCLFPMPGNHDVSLRFMNFETKGCRVGGLCQESAKAAWRIVVNYQHTRTS